MGNTGAMRADVKPKHMFIGRTCWSGATVKAKSLRGYRCARDGTIFKILQSGAILRENFTTQVAT